MWVILVYSGFCEHPSLDQWFSTCGSGPPGGPQIILGGPQMLSLINIVFSLNSKQSLSVEGMCTFLKWQFKVF